MNFSLLSIWLGVYSIYTDNMDKTSGRPLEEECVAFA